MTQPGSEPCREGEKSVPNPARRDQPRPERQPTPGPSRTPEREPAKHLSIFRSY